MEENISRSSTPSGTREISVDENPASQTRANITQPKPRNKMRARIVQIVSVLILIVLLVVLWRFLGDKSAQKTAGAGGAGRGEVVPVEMATVTQKDVPIQLKAI